MNLVIDIATFKIKKNAMLPTFEIEIRAKHQESRDAFYTSAMCEIFLGEGNSFDVMPYLTRVPVMINEQVQSNGSLKFKFDLTITQELGYLIERFTIEGRDISLAISVIAQMLFTEKLTTQNEIKVGGWSSDSCHLIIGIGEWVKAVTNRPDYMLIPVSPETHEKLRKLLTKYRPMSNLEDIITDLIELNTKPAKKSQ